MIDEKALMYQNIVCRAAANAFPDCHTVTRSLCEIQFTCGSARPLSCDCVFEYGYPEPVPRTNQTGTSFKQNCVEKCEASGWSDKTCAEWREKTM